MTTRNQDIARLRHHIAKAQQSWIGADWTHELVTDGECIRDERGRQVYCEGHLDHCDTCRDATNDAALAAINGDMAFGALDADDIAHAVLALRRAAELEAHYGDDMHWGLCRRLARAIEEIRQ